MHSTKISDGAVTADKIDAASVVTTKIHDDAVTAAKISNGAISNAHINNSAAISPSKISGTAATLSGTQTFIGWNNFDDRVIVGTDANDQFDALFEVRAGTGNLFSYGIQSRKVGGCTPGASGRIVGPTTPRGIPRA